MEKETIQVLSAQKEELFQALIEDIKPMLKSILDGYPDIQEKVRKLKASKG